MEHINVINLHFMLIDAIMSYNYSDLLQNRGGR